MWVAACCVLLAAAEKPQPIPFSHKLHVAMGQKCGDCHTMPDPGDLATYPKESKCMSCHAAIRAGSPAIRKLVEFYKNQKPVPWVRVYKVPEFVFFSHKEHQRAKVGCESCHGAVGERDVLTAEKSTKMVACMDCHERSGASNACNFCHNP